MLRCRATSHLSPRLRWRSNNEAQRDPGKPAVRPDMDYPGWAIWLPEEDWRSRASVADITRDITRKAVV